MSTPQSDDQEHARFRRDASTPAAAPGGPQVPAPVRPAAPPPAVFTPPREGPITVESLPRGADPQDPRIPRPLFGELVEGRREEGDGLEPLFRFPERDDSEGAAPDGSSSEWVEGDRDPGRTTGIVSIVVGAFVGVVGVFIAISAIRRSREVGLVGALGFVGILVSIASVIVAGTIGVSYVRYEASLAQQCSLVGPGQYLTQSGDQITCP